MVEQGTHKPLDVGSNPTLATQPPVTFCEPHFASSHHFRNLLVRMRENVQEGPVRCAVLPGSKGDRPQVQFTMS